MKTQLTLLLLVITTPLFAQIPDNPNFTDANGLKQGKWTILLDSAFHQTDNLDSARYYRLVEYKDDKPNGMVHDFYRNGQKQWEGYLLKDDLKGEGVMHGKAIWYRQDGSIDGEALFSEGRVIHVKLYTPDGEVEEVKWEALNNQAIDAAASGFPEESVEIMRWALRQARAEFGEKHANYAIALHNLAFHYADVQQYDSAEKYYVKAKALKKELYGEMNEEYASTVQELASVYEDKKQYDKATPLYQQAIKIRRQVLGDKDPSLAVSLNNLGLVNIYESRFAEAEPLLLESLKICNEAYGEDDQECLSTMGNLALLYSAQSFYKKAEDIYFKELALKKKYYGPDHSSTGVTLKEMGRFYDLTGDYKKSENLQKQALEIFEKTVGIYSTEYTASLNNLATVYTKQGRYAEAIEAFERVLKIKKEVFDPVSQTIAISLNNLAVVYEDMGNFDKAEELYSQVYKIDKATLKPGDPNFAITLNNMAALAKNKGDLIKAEPLFLQALEIRKNVYGKMHPQYAQGLTNLAEFYISLGRNDIAQLLFQEAANVYRQVLGENHPDYARAVLGLADLYTQQGEYAKADTLISQAVRINRLTLGANHPTYATTLTYLANNRKLMGLYDEADSLLRLGMKIRKDIFGEKNPDYASSLNNLGSNYSRQGLYEMAETLYKKAVDIRKEVLGETNPDYINSLNNLAYIYYKEGKFNEAEPYYLSMLKNKLNGVNELLNTMSESERKLFLKSIYYLFNNFYRFAIHYYNENPSISAHLFDLQLETKGLLFHSTQKMQQQILASNDEDLINTYYQWKSRKSFLARVLQMPLEEKEKLGIDEEDLKEDVNQLERSLSQRSGAFATSTDTLNYSWKDIRDRLKKEEAAIEMIRIRTYEDMNDTIYAVLVVKPDTKEYPEMITFKGKYLEDTYLKRYRNAMAFRVRDPESYAQFWEPIRQHLQGVKKVYLSADGVYHQVNVLTLLNPQTDKYVADEIEVQLVSSTKEILTPASSVLPSHINIQLFGFPAYDGKQVDEESLPDDFTMARAFSEDTTQRFFSVSGKVSLLPGTKAEVEGIGQLARKNKANVSLHTGMDASEENIKHLSNPDILHMATHGFFLSNLPETDENQEGFIGMDTRKFLENPLLRSGLLFAGAEQGIKGSVKEGEDGILTAQEALSLSLDSTQLVVMSACETGLGEISNGEGVYGLQRAFQQAGAKSILMSLWKVNDAATQEMMTLFYKNLIEKRLPLRKSFTAAQQALRKKYPDPYFWGAFVLIGE